MALKYKIMDRISTDISDLSHDLGVLMLRGMMTRNQYAALLKLLTPYLPRHVTLEMRTPKGVIRAALGGDEPLEFRLSPRAKLI